MSDVATATSFITWYPTCRRSDTIAAALGGSSHLVHYLKFKQPLYAPFKYVAQSISSVRRLNADSPDVVFVAVPPSFAALMVWAFCRLTGRRFVIDAHTGLFDDHRWTWLEPLNKFLARRAIVTIVTNEHLASKVHEWGGRSIVIGDVPVEFNSPKQVDLGPGQHVVVVNTFSVDEPLDEIIAAAKSVPTVTFHITGNPKHARTDWSDELPGNARLTGWVTEEEYASLMASCDAVVCLTTHDHTMQRGAYEAMALGRPLVTSDWPILRETFSEGTLHVDNSAEGIAMAVKTALDNAESLSKKMADWAGLRRKVFNQRMQELKELISQGT